MEGNIVSSVSTVAVDIIIVSYAQNNDLLETTKSCVSSLMISEEPAEVKFNVIVLESQTSLKPYQYPGSSTVYPDVPFGYHKYLNIGIAMTSSPYVCLCNNDLIFHKNWATELLKPLLYYSDVSGVSPVCSIHHPKMGFKLNDGYRLGLRIRYEVSGWCIMVKRDVFKRMGKLDENFIFWGADNDYVNTFYVLGLNHLLVTSSIVDHFENKTLKAQNEARQDELTVQTVVYFDKKWKPRMGDGWQLLE